MEYCGRTLWCSLSHPPLLLLAHLLGLAHLSFVLQVVHVLAHVDDDDDGVLVVLVVVLLDLAHLEKFSLLFESRCRLNGKTQNSYW